jgi:predicted XRE-type DNA-binding protein/predicted DNA-binding transcriptional regulator AlpA
MTTAQRFTSIWDAIEDTHSASGQYACPLQPDDESDRGHRQQGMTQAQAAALFGVTQPRISDLMRGKVNLFSLDALMDMAASSRHGPDHSGVQAQGHTTGPPSCTQNTGPRLTSYATTAPVVQWLKTAAMAARISRKPAVLIRMAKRGTLPAPARLGKAMLWNVQDVEAALQAAQKGGE